jgi:hypothetical protein
MQICDRKIQAEQVNLYLSGPGMQLLWKQREQQPSTCA